MIQDVWRERLLAEADVETKLDEVANEEYVEREKAAEKRLKDAIAKKRKFRNKTIKQWDTDAGNFAEYMEDLADLAEGK